MNASEQGWPELVRCIFEDDVAAVPIAIARGADPNGSYAGGSLVGLATMNGAADVLEALIAGGAHVPVEALSPLGDMDITDWKIDNVETERAFARVAEILLAHGATPLVFAYDGRRLIDTFPLPFYHNLHRVLASALASFKPSAP